MTTCNARSVLMLPGTLANTFVARFSVASAWIGMEDKSLVPTAEKTHVLTLTSQMSEVSNLLLLWLDSKLSCTGNFQ